MTEREEIEVLKRTALSEDWEAAIKAGERLGEIRGENVFQFLISLLASKRSEIRNLAALRLRDLKDSRAVEPLLMAINKKENFNYNGTMAYALETLDCSQKLKELFELLFYQDYEVKVSAMNVLNRQIFEFDKDDLVEIKTMWEDCKVNHEKCPEFEGCKDDIQDFVDYFMTYLEE
jgi:HEAT repeat protein